MTKPKVLVLSGYGINCERETQFAFEMAGAEAEIVHVNDLIDGKKSLENYQIVAFPGGFSYGDDTGSGNAMANKIRLNLWKQITKFIEAGKLIIGICNGFQVLVNLGLLPGIEKKYGERKAVLTFNNSARYECRWVNVKARESRCVFTKGIEGLYVPVAHGEGKFVADENVLDKLESNGQVVFSYSLQNGNDANGEFPFNPNGSLRDVAGICDETGRILGMMPHPERALLNANSPKFQNLKEAYKRAGMAIPEFYEPAVKIFKNAVSYVNENFDLKEVKGISYADSGVNIELGDDASKVLYEAAKATWQNRNGKLGEVIVPTDDFSGVRAIDVGKLPEGTFMNIGFDGIGTKAELAERVGDHTTIAHDLFAMVCDDASVRGAEPVLVGTILDVNTLGNSENSHLEKVRQLAKGYIDAAKTADVAIVNGEIAELGGRVSGYGKFNYNWGAGVVWFAKKERMFNGKEIKAGDFVVAFHENGFRSNGLSLARKVFKEVHGDEWHNVQFNNSTLGKLALTPSKIYCKTITEIHGGLEGEQKAEIHGVAHITGGGIPGKLGRVLKTSNLGAELEDLFAPSEIMLYCQELGNVPDEEAYKTWNMGNGMLVITPEPEKVINLAQKNGIEAKCVGTIVDSPRIRIKSKGAFASKNGLIEF